MMGRATPVERVSTQGEEMVGSAMLERRTADGFSWKQ